LGLLVEIDILIPRLVKQDFKRREELKVACNVGAGWGGFETW
jgi:hypothetical protein